jgi:asparagine synthase (glutamine-hydrolysing)
MRETLLSPESLPAKWFQREAMVKLIAEHQSGKQDHGKRLWALACLSLWARQNAPQIAL